MKAILVFIVSVVLASGAARAEGARVTDFSPAAGEAPGGEVHARFDRPMTAFGDSAAAAPFEVDCIAEGRGRWVDERNWVFEFVDGLPAAVECRFTVRADLAALDGSTVEPGEFSFSTGGPRILHVLPYEGTADVDEEQVFLVGFDTPVAPEALAASAWCEVEGLTERIDVEVVAADVRDEILAAREDFADTYDAALTDYGRRAAAMVIDGRLVAGDGPAVVAAALAAEQPAVIALACRRRLPPGSGVALVFDAGLRAATGAAASSPRRLAWRTRESFRADFSCRRTRADAGCNPVLPMTVSFTAPVARSQAARIALAAPDGAVVAPDLDEEGEWVTAVGFPGPFAEAAEYRLDVPADLVDDAGRALSNADRFPLAVATDEASPLIRFPAPFGIIEYADGGAALPVTLRNIEAVVPLAPAAGEVAEPHGLDPAAAPWYRRWYRQFRERHWPRAAEINGRTLRVTDPVEAYRWMERVRRLATTEGHYDDARGRWVVDSRPGERSLFGDGADTTAFTLPKPGGARPMEVIGIPLDAPGFYVVEIASPRLGAALMGEAVPYHAQTAVLVTNLAAHFKHGAESSLVWVTTLADAEPVAGAAVAVRDCAGRDLFTGVTGDDGTLHIEGALPPLANGCGDYIVSATLGDDTTFTLSGWSDGIEPWRFNLPHASWTAPNLAATVFDRPLYRVGDTVHMKHFARRHRGAGFDLPGAGTLPDRIELVHDGSGTRYEVAARFDAGGIAESRWIVPGGARLGRYRATVTIDDPERGQVAIESGSFRVEEFRVPTMSAVVTPVAAELVRAESAAVDVQLNYLAGGAAGGTPVTVRSAARAMPVHFDGFEGFTFAGDVAEGREDDAAAAAATPREQRLELDAAGSARVVIDGLADAAIPRRLEVEVEYPDAAGETLAAATRIDLWPSAVVLGIRPDGWAASRELLAFAVVAVDTAGKPLADTAIAVEAFRRTVYSHRKRLLGGFYSWESVREISRLGPLCRGRTDHAGLLHCEVEAPADGNLVLRASAADAAGNEASAAADVWVAGEGDWWFDLGDDDRMDVIPERRRYEPGESAVLQVRMPFRRATALVTVEREGVLDARVVRLDGSRPIVEVPVLAHHAPNVYVSVLAVRGRIADAVPTALVDLDKPSYRLGIAAIDVGRVGHELDVEVDAGRSVYQARETAVVDIRVARADGGALPDGAEIALAAVDEGLLELLPNSSWDLLEAMMGRRGIAVDTATAQMQVVGKRHFGVKAVAAGGGGGESSVRELFDTLLAWRGRVPLDASGSARVEVPLNDSLSAFRIVAVASAGAGLFGTGSTSIRTTRDVMLLPGLPLVLRGGDRFDATVTVRNAAADGAARTVTVSAAVSEDARATALAPRTVTLAAGEARELAFDIEVGEGAERLAFEATAEVDGVVADRVAVEREVIAAVPVRVQQATLVRLDDTATLPVTVPLGALPGRGAVRVNISPSLAGGLAGVADFMREYPYTCLEQRVSRAVVLGDEAMATALAAELPGFLDGDGLARFWPTMARGDEVLTAYVLSVADEAGWTLPRAAVDAMLGGLAAFVDGSLRRPSLLPAADLALRKLSAMEALSRHRAIDPAWLTTIDIVPERWPTSALLDWAMLLGRSEHVAEGEALRARAIDLLRARFVYRGTMLGFAGESRDNLWWLMVSPDVNANRAVLALAGELDTGDTARLLRGALARRDGGKWSTTVANAWGVLAARNVAGRLEAEPVDGITHAALGEARDWIRSDRPGILALPWPDAPGVLTMRHHGGGAPWATVEGLAAVPPATAVSSGYTVSRRVEPVLQRGPGAWRRGDVARVVLDITAAADMTWVVVDDPVPAGATILGGGLRTDARLAAADGDGEAEGEPGRLRPAFEEHAADAYRAYYDFMPRGRWRLEYRVRLNTAGTFAMAPTRVEAMYAPDVHGVAPNDPVVIGR